MTLTSIYQRLEKKKKIDRESEFSCTPPPPQSTVSSLCIPFGEGKGRLAGEIFRTVHYKIVISNWIVFLSSKEKKPCAKDIPGGISTYWNTRHWTVFVFVPAFINFTRILYTGSPLRKRFRRRLNADNNSTRDHPAYDFGALIIIKLIFIKRQVPGGSSCALCAITIQYRRFDIIRPMKIIEKKKKYQNFGVANIIILPRGATPGCTGIQILENRKTLTRNVSYYLIAFLCFRVIEFALGRLFRMCLSP